MFTTSCDFLRLFASNYKAPKSLIIALACRVVFNCSQSTIFLAFAVVSGDDAGGSLRWKDDTRHQFPEPCIVVSTLNPVSSQLENNMTLLIIPHFSSGRSKKLHLEDGKVQNYRVVSPFREKSVEHETKETCVDVSTTLLKASRLRKLPCEWKCWMNCVSFPFKTKTGKNLARSSFTSVFPTIRIIPATGLVCGREESSPFTRTHPARPASPRKRTENSFIFVVEECFSFRFLSSSFFGVAKAKMGKASDEWHFRYINESAFRGAFDSRKDFRFYFTVITFPFI